jgi:hypothetical protein
VLILWVTQAPAIAQRAFELEKESSAPRMRDGVAWRETVRVERSAHACAWFGKPEFAPCLRHVVTLRNESERRIQCKATLEMTLSSVNGERRFEAEFILLPGRDSHELEAVGPEHSESYLRADCGFVPSPPPLEGPPCEFEATVVDLDGFYPPGSLRRREIGEAVIEFTVDAGRKYPRDITLVSKSGYADLDTAAVRIGRMLRIATQCKNARVRRAILFDQYSDVYPSPRIGMILMTDYVESAK